MNGQMCRRSNNATLQYFKDRRLAHKLLSSKNEWPNVFGVVEDEDITRDSLPSEDIGIDPLESKAKENWELEETGVTSGEDDVSLGSNLKMAETWVRLLVGETPENEDYDEVAGEVDDNAQVYFVVDKDGDFADEVNKAGVPVLNLE